MLLFTQKCKKRSLNYENKSSMSLLFHGFHTWKLLLSYAVASTPMQLCCEMCNKASIFIKSMFLLTNSLVFPDRPEVDVGLMTSVLAEGKIFGGKDGRVENKTYQL